jgi:hypothetical protein
LVNEPGTDGTVRWAGCSLSTQKITIDLTRDPDPSQPREPRAAATDNVARGVLPMPFWPIAGKNHATILNEPGDTLVDLVVSALQVDSDGAFDGWQATAKRLTGDARSKIKEWQQFVVRAIDDRGDPITDYHLELFVKRGNGEGVPLDFDLDVHAYGADESLRCFHVQLAPLLEKLHQLAGGDLWVRIIAPSGSDLVGYHGIHSEKLSPDLTEMNEDGVWDAQIELPREFSDTGVTLLYPFTTTFVEMRLNRDPMPFGVIKNKICSLLDD